MRIQIIIASLICIIFSLACSRYEPVLAPEININSNPYKKYKVILVIENSPGKISVTGEANYAMKNGGRCVPVDRRRSLGGSSPIFSKKLDIPVKEISKDTYEITFYDDALMDEDYYGKGVCEWSGSPAFRIYFSGASYTASSASRTTSGEPVSVVCMKRSSGSIGSCRNEEYDKNANPGTHFYLTITTYKE